MLKTLKRRWVQRKFTRQLQQFETLMSKNKHTPNLFDVISKQVGSEDLSRFTPVDTDRLTLKLWYTNFQELNSTLETAIIRIENVEHLKNDLDFQLNTPKNIAVNDWLIDKDNVYISLDEAWKILQGNYYTLASTLYECESIRETMYPYYNRRLLRVYHDTFSWFKLLNTLVTDDG
ncbi:hypothetical protein [Endozoicomonas sp. ONNA1]|uniref:hypothetical protein n=1 Tax=Endozoicomonas sp. ONNA1 TaxID=2828740 RepID=UPI002147ABEC|nr:hypothetical protein [Endozoicomonas sp. ONNA1]